MICLFLLYLNKYKLFILVSNYPNKELIRYKLQTLSIAAQLMFKTLYLGEYMQTSKRIFNIVKNISHIFYGIKVSFLRNKTLFQREYLWYIKRHKFTALFINEVNKAWSIRTSVQQPVLNCSQVKGDRVLKNLLINLQIETWRIDSKCKKILVPG